MNTPSPAQRADWFTRQYEAKLLADERYGTGHRPSYAKVGAGYVSACSCAASCTRADDACLYQTWDLALDAAKTNLQLAEHGEAS